MATAVETLGKLERRITISFPLTDVRTEVEKRLKVQARTAKAPGFRPGKVPLKMVAAQYGYQIESEVLNDKVGRAFNDAANENNLRVAGFPNIVPKEEAAEGQQRRQRDLQKGDHSTISLRSTNLLSTTVLQKPSMAMISAASK